VKVNVNGTEYEVVVSPAMRLLDFLRNELKLTGTKEGCGEGECGACMVLVDGRLANSCLILIGQLAGKTVTSIEGIDNPQLFAAFEKSGAVQCGFCTPGFVMAAEALLRNNPTPDENQIKQAIAGNLCRCTGYQKIVGAIQMASQKP
jgi:carbon-monoxide dehydrogenase small subunit